MLALRRGTISSWKHGFNPGAIQICSQFDASSFASRNTPPLQHQQQVYSTAVQTPPHYTLSAYHIPSYRQNLSRTGAKGSLLGFVGRLSTSTGFPGGVQEMPPEALGKSTVLSPDRPLGVYADLVARVTNFQNEDRGLMVLAGDVFDVPIRKDIVQRVVRWQLAKRQQGTHCTKTISEVSGTGRKPWKQKGTGRARHGTLRGPQFRHGATMHGPKPRSHAIKLQKKVRRLGLKIALSARTAEGKLVVFEDLAVPTHKTKHIVACLSHIENAKKILLVDGGSIEENLKLATQNLHYVNVLPSIGLNVYDILKHDTLVMTKDAVNRIVERMHTPINR